MEFGRAVFEIRERTDRQTDRHTDGLIAVLRTPISRLFGDVLGGV